MMDYRWFPFKNLLNIKKNISYLKVINPVFMISICKKKI